jgi:predicted O-linked N-acetylglucosamine transferase (SPINDLY family)
MNEALNREMIVKAQALILSNQVNTAIEILLELLQIYPNHPQVLELIAFISNNALNATEAIKLLESCIGLGVTSPIIFYELGSHYLNLGELLLAIDALKKALKQNPHYFEALHDLGAALALSGNKKEALENFLLASKINHQSAELFYNLGRLCDEQYQFDRAIGFYQEATRINPSYTEAWINLAIDLGIFKRYGESLQCLENAYLLNPSIDFLYGDYIFIKMRMCQWEENAQYHNQLLKKIEDGEKITPPFPLMALVDSASIIQKAAAIYAESRYPLNASLGPIAQNSNQRIRIGYFSADFHEHPVSYLTAELFELHDRNQFEVYAFSFGKNTNDAMRIRLENSFDHFIDVADKTPLEICQLSRETNIDIAIDLSGFTENARTEIFALRAAPIQISYIGFLGTMGTQYIDYLIADEIIIPVHLRKFYSEKIIYLPSYQANDSKRAPSAKIFSKSDLGIKDNQFVFCNLNNVYKITPLVFKSWMKILDLVPDSVLMLYAENSWAMENLKRQAMNQGINPNRLIFIGHLPRAEYLSRYAVADLFLDTYPYNAGTTASDALWMGLPVLTLQGESFASRVASSLLVNLHLVELIQHSTADYEAQAVKLANQPNTLQLIKDSLAKTRSSAPLFNTNRFIKNLEGSFQKAYLRHKEDLLPIDIIQKEHSDFST